MRVCARASASNLPTLGSGARVLSGRRDADVRRGHVTVLERSGDADGAER